jgi:menaquinone-9 beta-reductase
VSDTFDVEVAVVGGGPAGAAVARGLAAAGHDVVVFERLTQPVWRACGVYSSALTRERLAGLGLGVTQLDELIRPIPRMVVQTADGTAECSLDYPAPRSACGVDRVSLEVALLELIRGAGVRVYEGAVVRSVELDRERSRLHVSQAGDLRTWSARVVVGADGPTSVVARSAGVALEARLFRRAALTCHRALTATDARLVVGAGWYMGIAPVPRDRVNLGLVIGERELRYRLRHGTTSDVMNSSLREMPSATEVRNAADTDQVAVHLPLLHRVRRTAGDGFVLVGDAAGFVDPISGEGLHRALVTAEFASRAIHSHLRGDATALREYDRRLRARFRSKDALSWALQLFMLRPELAHRAIRRLDRNTQMRATFAAALADLAPASSVFDPRFVGPLLA